ncbi:prolipoprotein diacylglyceryl transferase [Mogibacterium pumilum]|uniref:Phosphatidylglycerol--prolipoprotein diacylglyceryl transferase n=1 Tax=Mogibacterium pumilum TaxID=86332 RepID=A0A223ASD1_9FIRM|nr:prolipoprotein diacylglyceryl transferase [Mogibacterium pumilum]ASS37881.1 prolipoprotein diacylglyceryl transferase [Mogibacterium pumilum]
MTSPGSIAISIAGFDIKWYGILIASGALLALFISYKRAPRCGLSPEDVLDIVLGILPMGVIGARIYYVIFNWSYYSKYPSEVINIRSGGLAIHGGLIFGFITAYIICKYKKIRFVDVADLILPSVALAQAIGRWGNFFNNEAYGTETNLPWAIIIDGKSVHPTFLYESIWCLLMFIALSYMYKRRKFPGQIACLYGLLYAPERFLVEGLRTDSLMIGFLRQAQVISIVIFFASLTLYLYLKRRSTLNN